MKTLNAIKANLMIVPCVLAVAGLLVDVALIVVNVVNYFMGV
ncbi:hypothetical protein PV783_33895 [Chitinophaga sp. CC14]